MTRTDTERLDFIICHAPDIDLHVIAYSHNPREAIDARMAGWDKRLADIAAGKVRPSLEGGRFADAQHPQGVTRADIEAKAKRNWS